MSNTTNDEGDLTPEEMDDAGRIEDDVQPETQGETPLDAELGEEGQGDILPEDEPADGDDDSEIQVEELP
ncbi:hypothetical protein [Microbacterium hominis]|uniref:Sugar ABC transporter ATPase n=1 Tax=Microbacterium hominis TaxID=162426 RepID=A0A7D4UHW9_9MICO|nr:hypothetical protein [Microbacterium hominis]QKJ18968.1 hypothetical protein HQM25_05955 [Microbacterium hominis]